ncbi:MAG: Zinc metalloprotease [Candidatus Tokpelaia hoelldobleri]|uniref:Zinc metalloprotease n=1 Tax=Candidatus Tokpelaia hoelldobleri TaxID=1902579 RepID=A0A1U9JU95_9HYPH|nr:MAG: Zinc metalloprotease [Candidatus Tokpelaia hoelldoblerii]
MVDLLQISEPALRIAGVVGLLLVIVFVHEMGHYLVGRWCGIGAAAFSVGFGRELFGFTDKRGTRWKLSAIPLGGYVKFVGDMNAASMPAENRTGDDRRADSFAAANVWKRMATVFAGPLFNAILTLVVLTVFIWINGRFIITPVISEVIAGSPAAHAGFEAGDKILTMQGNTVISYDDIPRYVRVHEEEKIDFTVERAGRIVPLTVVPRVTVVDDGFGSNIRVGQIGVKHDPTGQTVRKVSYNLWQSLNYGLDESGYIIRQTGRFLGKAFQGQADRCQLSGPVKSAQIAWKFSDLGFGALIQLMAFFSLSVGLFNLLPLPPLDGGHLVFYLVEAVIGRPVPLAVQEKIFMFGFILVLVFVALATVNNFIPC